MKQFFVHDAFGRIYSSGTCQADTLAQQGNGIYLVQEGSADPFNDYFDGTSAVPMPARPSTFHTFDYVSKSWVDRRSLDVLKESKWREIKQARSAFEFGGFTWDGSVFDSDSTSQSRIMGAVQLAAMSSSFSIEWTLADNSLRLLSSTDLINLGMTLGVHVGTAHEIARQLRVAIDAATSPEQLINIIFQE